MAMKPSLLDPKVKRNEEAAYFKEASAWDDDRVVSLRKSRRTGWWVASAEFALIVMLAVAILVMLPLKTTDVRLVRVDSSTGIVDQVVKLADSKETYDEAMTKFFLRRVVALRETYTRAQLQNDYDQSVLFTAPNARGQLKADFSFDNPNGPYKRYGELGTASVQIVAIAFVAKNIAQVRYVRTDRKGGAESQSHWVATVEFRYVSQPAGEEARGINPLGFQVTNYRNDPEALLEASRP
jgi:type IV secretion system protein VirB8